ncbi:MAG: amidophosphoribosyltransferase, partial [Bacteroidia bacterium]|nr:amidophosphoribosyltransferase [Bacteroidia bacterium]
MSDEIKHECGIAVLRLLKPLSYYRDKYGTPLYGLDKLYLLMEKQHNRGQDGAGVVNIKLDVDAGNKYFSRIRSVKSQPIQDVFAQINKPIAKLRRKFPEKIEDLDWLKKNVAFTGELFMGHLRYGTYGVNGIESCHPLLRQNNWKSRNLAVAGNFNLTNVDEIFDELVQLGQHPKERSDTVTILEKIGHFLDEENDILFKRFNADNYTNKEISTLIASEIDLKPILSRAAKRWDGGFTIGGLLGHGDAFVMRDPNGIRPAYYYHDDEIAVVASERPAIQTAFNLSSDQLKEIKPGHALIIKASGQIYEKEFKTPGVKKSCSFERIYFSRGTDVD